MTAIRIVRSEQYGSPRLFSQLQSSGAVERAAVTSFLFTRKLSTRTESTAKVIHEPWLSSANDEGKQPAFDSQSSDRLDRFAFENRSRCHRTAPVMASRDVKRPSQSRDTLTVRALSTHIVTVT
jgi:hypothetical protein